MTQARPIQQQAQSWLAEYVDGLSPSRLAEFEEWLDQSRAHGAAFAAAQQLWDELGWDETLNAQALQMDEAERVASGKVGWMCRLAEMMERFDGWLAGGAAAALTAVVLLAFVLPDLRAPITIQSEQAAVHVERYAVSTDVGEIRQIELADGSMVTLGGATVIEVALSPDYRQVTMPAGGDALFEVSPDAERPFSVNTGGVSATVLGTVFEINSARTAARVSVVEGRVRVAGAGHQQDLGAGERIIAQAGRSWRYETFDADHAARWRSTRMVFRDAPLSQIVEDLNRYSDAGVQIENEDLENLRVTSSFRIDQLESALHGIALSYGLIVEGDASTGFILRRDDSSE